MESIIARRAIADDEWGVGDHRFVVGAAGTGDDVGDLEHLLEFKNVVFKNFHDTFNILHSDVVGVLGCGLIEVLVDNVATPASCLAEAGEDAAEDATVAVDVAERRGDLAILCLLGRIAEGDFSSGGFTL